MDFKTFLGKTDAWMASHWRACLSSLLLIIAMQQCTIGSLHSQIERMGKSMTPTVALADTTTTGAPDTTSPTDTAAASTPAGISQPAEPESHSNIPFVVFVIVLAAAAYAVWHALRTGKYPIGLWVGGRLRQENDGRLVFSLNVKNRSQKDFEVTEPMVNFRSRNTTRRFRANLNSMPITLQAGTQFNTTLTINGLIERNPELQQAYAITVSVVIDGKRHSTPPSFVRFKQA